MFYTKLELNFYSDDDGVRTFSATDRVNETLSLENVKKYFINSIGFLVPTVNLNLNKLTYGYIEHSGAIYCSYFFEDNKQEFFLTARTH